MDPKADQTELIATIQRLQETQTQLVAAVQTLTNRVDSAIPETASPTFQGTPVARPLQIGNGNKADVPPASSDESSALAGQDEDVKPLQAPVPPSPTQKPGLTSRIILT